MKRNSGYVWKTLALSTLAVAALVAMIPVGAVAGDESGGVPGDWLSRYSGARSVGLGGAFVATADEPIGAVWNPAGLSSVMQNEVHFEQTRLFEGTTMNGIGVVFPVPHLSDARSVDDLAR